MLIQDEDMGAQELKAILFEIDVGLTEMKNFKFDQVVTKVYRLITVSSIRH